MKTQQIKGLVCGLAIAATALSCSLPAQAQRAKRSTQSVLLERWPGRRVVLVSPVTLGPNWNADPALGQALLRDGEFLLSDALRDTDKLSVIQLERFNSIFVRAVQEKQMTMEELTDLTDPASTTPWMQRARTALSKLRFEQSPLIGEFTLEELRTGGDARNPSVQVQVSGRMYELDRDSPDQHIITSNPIAVRRDLFGAIRNATDDAFQQLASYYTQPINALQLAMPTTATPATRPGGPAPAVLIPGMSFPTPPAPTPPTLPNGQPLPGDVPIAGSSTRGSGPATPIGPPNTTTLPAVPSNVPPGLVSPNGTGTTPAAPADNTTPATPAPTAPAPGEPGTAPAPPPTTPAPAG